MEVTGQLLDEKRQVLELQKQLLVEKSQLWKLQG